MLSLFAGERSGTGPSGAPPWTMIGQLNAKLSSPRAPQEITRRMLHVAALLLGKEAWKGP